MDTFCFDGGIEVRVSERRVLVRGAPVALGGRAFDLLVALIGRRDRLVGKDELMDAVWPGIAVEENNLTVQISALRKVLGADAIATVAGRGYQLTLARAEPADRPRSTAPDDRVVAVLAFDNHSNDPELQFFSDGISDAIISRLAGAEGVRVVSRLSSFQFRGPAKAEAAARLGCDYLLDGSVRRDSARVRIGVQLSDTATGTTLWSERFESGIDEVFAIEDGIAASVAGALQRTLAGSRAHPVAAADYDLYLRASPGAYSPDELRRCVNLLEVVTERAPHFTEAWGRAAYLRGFLHVYLPFAERPANARRVEAEAAACLALDPGNIDALAARCFIAPPYGSFAGFDRALEALQQARGAGDGRRYIGWFLRHTGRVREALEETQAAYRLDPLDPMSINLLALARMAAGQVTEAIPLYADLVERMPQMSFPISSLLRAHALRGDWAEVDRLLEIAATRPLREFQDTIPFVLAKRDPARIDDWRGAFEAHIAKSGWVDAARLVYAAHLGLVDDAYRAATVCRLGPSGAADDMMGPDGYRTALLFQASLPELRNDRRFPALCARLGLVDFWAATGKWPDCADETPYDFRNECLNAQETPREAFRFA